MSLLNTSVNNLPSDLQLSVFKFAVEDEDNIQTPHETVHSICTVCRQWTELTYSSLLPRYWNGVKSFINTFILGSNQNFIGIATMLSSDHAGLIPFERLSKALRSSSLMVLPCQYQRLIDTSLEKVWGRISNQINFGQSRPPYLASEIRAWLKDPKNIPLIQTVRTLNLSGLELTLLPSEITDLTNLEELNLSKNNLTTLPSEICNFANLQRLYLNNNQITALPSEIGNLTNLQRLFLGYNHLTAVPIEIGNLANLQELNLDHNNLIAVPTGIGNLANLQRLFLGYNQLTAVPTEIGNLANLQELNFDHNNLIAVPTEIGNLANLQRLYLNHNHLTVLPTEIGNLANLQWLYLTQNNIKAVPIEIGNLANLQRLYLNHNHLTALPSEIGMLTNLQQLGLNNNNLTAIPSEIGNLPNLLWLYLSNNLCLFVFDKEFSKFVSIPAVRLFEKYDACKQYDAKTSFAKLCQRIHNQEDANQLKEMFNDLPSTMQKKIRSKIEDIFVALLENENIKNKELLKSQVLLAIFDARKDILTRAILDILRESLASITPEQKCLIYNHVWSLAGKPQGDDNWGESHAEDNIIRLIDAIVLAANAEE
ncbi:MAG: leucine-rich repeat domain-containing protein [Verrucomicrobia bacterium]|nr:leucine-rich repeat domain-containing protein [Verrucomicrobiota bacterium]